MDCPEASGHLTRRSGRGWTRRTELVRGAGRFGASALVRAAGGFGASALVRAARAAFGCGFGAAEAGTGLPGQLSRADCLVRNPVGAGLDTGLRDAADADPRVCLFGLDALYN